MNGVWTFKEKKPKVKSSDKQYFLNSILTQIVVRIIIQEKGEVCLPFENISSNLIRGNIDAFILKVLQEQDRYGYEIIKSILRKSGNAYELKEPSLYTSLKRLEKEHYIQSYWGDESLGARRKYYHITSDGIEYLHRAILQWRSAQKIISKVLMGGTKNG